MSLTDLAHNLVSNKFKSINYAVDATCGNGYDTLFLAERCVDDGIVYSFDIQEDALNNTASILGNNNLIYKVSLIHDGHEKMLDYIDHKVGVIMFNLGYLPNSDRMICTNSKNTITALESSLKILSPNGLISVLCYPKHNSGRLETDSVRNWIFGLSKNEYKQGEYLSENPDDTTPVLFIIEKK